MADKIATRESYGNALAELGAKNPNVVVLDADLAAATKTGVFKIFIYFLNTSVFSLFFFC